MIFNIPIADIVIGALGLVLVAVFVFTVFRRKNCKCGCEKCENKKSCCSCGKRE